MRRRSRWAAATAAAVLLAVLLSVVVAVLPSGTGGRGDGGRPSPAAAARPGSVQALQSELEQSPEDWRGWAALGHAYLEQARVSGDGAYYNRSEEAFRRALAVRPDDNVEAWTGQAALAAARHEFAEALELSSRALELDTFHPPALAVRADALLELGRYDEAFAAIAELNEQKPGFPAYTRASYAAELRGDTEAALDIMALARDAASTPSERTFAATHLGQIAFGSGDLEAAEQHFSDGLRTDPGAPALLAGLARVAAARGEVQAAIDSYTESLSRRPDPGVAAELGDLYASLGRDAEAQVQYDVVAATQRLLAEQGQDVDLELALFDADHGQPERALAAAEAAYDDRQSVFTEDALAWALHRNGRSAEALPHVRAALALGTRSAVLHYHAGMVHAAVGDDESAERELATALSINPHFSPVHAPVAQRELERIRAARAG